MLTSEKETYKKKFKKAKSTSQIIHKTYKEKLLFTSHQKILASKTCGCCRLIYNICLHQREWAYRATGKSPGYIQQCLELTEVKKEFPWLNEPPSQPLQQAAKEVDTSMDRFFKGVSGYPHFRSKNQSNSFTFPQGVKNIRRTSKRRGKVFLPKFGEVSFRWTQPILGKLLETTIIQELDAWYICFVCELNSQEVQASFEEKEKEIEKTPVGIDRGIYKTAALSNGKIKNLPIEVLKEVETKIACFQRKFSKKKKGSKNRRKLLKKIQKLHRRLFHLRDNWCHQVSHELAKNHGLVFMEALPIAQMVRSASGTLENPGTKVAAKSGLNKSTLRQGWGKLRNYTAYKQKWRGQHLLLVPAPYTSQTCFQCKYVDPENRDSKDREVFKCLRCHWTCDADLNAALNILFQGLVKLFSLVLMPTNYWLALAAGPAVAACGDARSQTRSMKQEPLNERS